MSCFFSLSYLYCKSVIMALNQLNSIDNILNQQKQLNDYLDKMKNANNLSKTSISETENIVSTINKNLNSHKEFIEEVKKIGESKGLSGEKLDKFVKNTFKDVGKLNDAKDKLEELNAELDVFNNKASLSPSEAKAKQALENKIRKSQEEVDLLKEKLKIQAEIDDTKLKNLEEYQNNQFEHEEQLQRVRESNQAELQKNEERASKLKKATAGAIAGGMFLTGAGKKIYNSDGSNVLTNIGDSLAGGAEMIGKAFGPMGEKIGKTIGMAIQGIAAMANMVVSHDSEMHRMMKNLGMSKKELGLYKEHMSSILTSMSSKWGKSMKDIVDAQESYMDSTGRAILLSEDGLDSMFAMEKVAGQDGLAIASQMDQYNHNIQDSIDLYYKMYEATSKMGLNTRKYTKDLAQNLALAHSYNFKDGVRGMMEMASWSQKMGVDLQKITSLADKIMSGGIEGVITQSAKLQVLGGARANMSNPLSMLYEAGNDMQSLGERIANMTKGLGALNQTTKEVTLTFEERQIMQSMSGALGIDRQELEKINRTRLRREDIQNHLEKYGLLNISEDFKETILNKAQWNQKTNEYEVTMSSGHRISVGQITESMAKDIVAEPEGSTMDDFAKANMSLSDNLNNATMAIKSGFGMFVYNNFGEILIKGVQWITDLLDMAGNGMDVDFGEKSEEYRLREELSLKNKEYEKMATRSEAIKISDKSLFSSSTSSSVNTRNLFSEGFDDKSNGGMSLYANNTNKTTVSTRTTSNNVSVKERDNTVKINENVSSVEHHLASLNERYEREVIGKNQDLNLNINGSLMLNGGDSNVDVGKLLAQDETFKRNITNIISDSVGQSRNGGRRNGLPQTSSIQTFA